MLATLRKLPMTWVGVAPFLIFAFLFLLLPTANIVTGAFVNDTGSFTLVNLGNLFKPEILNAFLLSIRLSFASAVIGCVLGFAIAVAVSLGGLPPGLRALTMTFSGVASNFAGVPLSFAYVATLGRVGFVTMLLKEGFGINIYNLGFNMISFWGLTMAYVFFQIPLMVLIITPASGVRRQRFWVPPQSNTGAWWPCRCCGQRCWAPWRCCLPMHLALSQPPSL